MSTANKISAALNSILGLVDKFSGIINTVTALDFRAITALAGNLDLNAINASIATITTAMNNIQNFGPGNFATTAAYQNFINMENTVIQNNINAINTVLGTLPSAAAINAITAQVNDLNRTFTTIKSDLDSALKPLDGLYAVGTAFSKLYIGATLGFAF
jgi:hypothetical protein